MHRDIPTTINEAKNVILRESTDSGHNFLARALTQLGGSLDLFYPEFYRTLWSSRFEDEICGSTFGTFLLERDSNSVLGYSLLIKSALKAKAYDDIDEFFPIALREVRSGRCVGDKRCDEILLWHFQIQRKTAKLETMDSCDTISLKARLDYLMLQQQDIKSMLDCFNQLPRSEVTNPTILQALDGFWNLYIGPQINKNWC